MDNGQRTIRHLVLALCIVVCALGIVGCSVPTLESPQCTDATLAVKQFYSFHFGNDMAPSAENLKAREKFLTSDLYRSLAASANGRTDYFTKSDEYPKTFKMATCNSGDPQHANVEVQTYWQEERGSTKSTTQREVTVATVKTNDGRWLIDNVSEGPKK
jgi:hypothetical protein